MPRGALQEAGDLGEGLFRFREEGMEVLRVAHPFEDLKRGLDPRLPQLAMGAHGVAEEEIARP